MRIRALFFVFCAWFSFPILADSYANNNDAKARMIALSENYPELELNYLFYLLSEIQRDDRVLELISRPAERVRPWFEYQKIFADEDRLEKGIAFYKNHQKVLEEIEALYGVDPFVIVAILGVETRYGKVVGSTDVLQALATLCLDYPPRAPFFCSEWEYFLRLSYRENWNPLSKKGSYAGAMGMAQFMPSSYFNDTVDFDEDGVVDLWQSPEDAIASIAFYLKKRGWQKEGKLYYPLPLKPDLPFFDNQHKPSFMLYDLALDSVLQNEENFISWLNHQENEMVGSLILQGEEGDLPFVTYNNFYVITRYNTSPMYAMAVSNLADAIRHAVDSSLD